MDAFFCLLQKVGLPVAILMIVLFRVDHYVGRLLSIFGSFQDSLDKLTTEIKLLSSKIGN